MLNHTHKEFYTSIPLWLTMAPPVFTYQRTATGRVTQIRPCLAGVHCKVGGTSYTFEKDDVSKAFMAEAGDRTQVTIEVVRVNEVDKKGNHTVKDRLIYFNLHSKNITAENVKYRTLLKISK
ncbi:MAG: hypothetical protein IJZ68_06560 [Bacteroidaceae bacterium]|nr:hypothetical protein [Bacteroidaceae bacterium]